MLRLWLPLALALSSATCFAPLSSNPHQSAGLLVLNASPVRLTVDLPPMDSDRTATMKIEPVLSVPSEFVEVRYKVPFELSVEPQKNLAVCTKAGPGGEKVGDILRYTSQWSLGLPQGEGLVATAAAFSGGLKWGCSMFDILEAKNWEQVVEALVSNTEDKTDEVVLIFERPLET